MYLLDTNVVSEVRKLKPHGAVLAWLQATPDHALYLSAVTLGEIQAGIEITRERDALKAATPQPPSPPRQTDSPHSPTP
jgi:predicted nucleic acid-binding protein